MIHMVGVALLVLLAELTGVALTAFALRFYYNLKTK